MADFGLEVLTERGYDSPEVVVSPARQTILVYDLEDNLHPRYRIKDGSKLDGTFFAQFFLAREKETRNRFTKDL